MTALNFSKEAFKVVNRLENHASSREFLAAAENIMSRGDADLTAALLASEAHKALQCAASLSSLGVVLEFEKACLYSRPERRGTRLLVGFTGSAHRLMMPLSIFQQALPLDTDLLILFDPLNDHYRKDILDGRSSLLSLPKMLSAIFDQYVSVIPFGSSGGGLPALRLARIANLQRGVSIGGRIINDTIRILRGIRTGSPYDPLCACTNGNDGQAILIYGEMHAADANSARVVASCIDADLIPIKGSAEHNVLWPIYKLGRLESFLEACLDTDSRPEAISKSISD